MRITGLTILLVTGGSLWAQTVPDTAYQVEVTTSMSPLISLFGQPRVPETENLPAFGYGAFIRGMWHPGRLLSVGLLSGYAVIARDEIFVDRPPGSPGATQSRYIAQLTAIPLQIAMSMQYRGVEAGIGIGPYLIISSIEGGGVPSASGSRLEIAMTYFASYMFRLDDSFHIGPELRLMTLSYRRIVTIMPSFAVRFTPLRY